MESFQSKLGKIMLKLTGRKRFWYKSGKSLKKGIARRRKLSHEPPKMLINAYHITKHSIDDQYYYVLDNAKNSDHTTHIFYLHGGAYVHEIDLFHWRFLGRLAKRLDCTITIPLYPLAPEHTYQDTFEFVYPLYKQISQKHHFDNMVLMGDSAGGGLALALAQLLLEHDFPQPSQTILISPWLDISLSNPEIDIIDKVDPFLAKPGTLEAGKMYAGDTDKQHYLLSPIYGRLKGLKEISLFMGTYDILVADARKFIDMAKKQGKLITYYEYPKMIHVFPLFSFPESKRALSKIVHIIKN